MSTQSTGGTTSTGLATNAGATTEVKKDLPKPPDSQPATAGEIESTAGATTATQKRVSLTGNGFEPTSILASVDESILFTNDGDTDRTITFNKGLPDVVLKPQEQRDVKIIHTGELRAQAGGKELIVNVQADKPRKR